MTLQLDVVAFTLARVHGEPVNDPVAVPAFVKPTVPNGAEVVPPDVSFTKPVQLIDWATATIEGEHVTAVVVLRLLIVTAALSPLLPVHFVVSLEV